MRIIVCIKQLSHIFARTGSDPAKNYLLEADRIFRLNPYDEFAFELALEGKRTIESCEIVLLTMGPLIAEKQLRRCFALGGDELVQIETDKDPDLLDSWQKSIMLARAVKELRGDIVLCGKESLDRRNGQVAAHIAQHLGLPFVSAISELMLHWDDRKALITRKARRGIREQWHCKLPAVFSVDYTSDKLSQPRLKNCYEANIYKIRTLYFGDSGDKPVVFLMNRYPPNPRTTHVIAPDSSLPAFNRIQELLAGSRVEKDSIMLNGSPADQVDGIIDFLKKQSFL